MTEFPFRTNDWVDVLDKENVWWQAIIMDITNNFVHVHFHGWSDNMDEQISMQSWKEYICPLHTHTCSRAKDSNGRPFVSGDVVDVRFGKNIELGMIVNVKNEYFIRTDESLDDSVFKKGVSYKRIIGHVPALNQPLEVWTSMMRKKHCIYYDNQKCLFPLMLGKDNDIFQTKPKIWKEEQEWNSSSKSQPPPPHIQLPHSDVQITFEIPDNSEQFSLTVHVHRAVLAMRSKYFNQLFFGPMSVSNMNVYYESLNVSSIESIKAVLFFLYHGQTQITNTTWIEIYHLSLFFQVEDLQEQIEKQDFTKVITNSNVCNLWDQAQMYDMSLFSDQIEAKIENILYCASQSQHQEIMKRMSFSMLKMILIRTKASTSLFNHQQQRFLFAIQWKKCHLNVVDEQTFFTFLRSQLCWADMSPAFLVNNVKPSGCLTDQHLFNVLLFQNTTSDKRMIIKQSPDIRFSNEM